MGERDREGQLTRSSTPTTAMDDDGTGSAGGVGVGAGEEEGGLGLGLGSAATAATHSVVSFCMQRNPWRYTNETPTHVPLHIEQQPGEGQ